MTPATLLVLPFGLSLAVAALGVLVRARRGRQRGLTTALLVSLASVGVGLVAATRDGVTVATRIGDWPGGLSIPFAADGFAAMLLVATSVVAALAVTFAVARGEDAHPLFHPMVAVLLAGVQGSFLTADLFNLFVTFEVMLIASYVLLTLRGGRRQVRAGTVYVAVNLLASTLFLLGVALVYGAAGTVLFAELAGVVTEVPTAAVGVGLVTVAVGVKASLVPMHSWLPHAYTAAGPAVTALFSGLLTKAGVYVLFRLASVVYAGDPPWRSVLLVVAGVTMVIGVLGAVGRGDVRGILAFHMVSQVGYLVLPLGLWSTAGITAGIVYLLQYVLVKGALFVSAGTIETLRGTGELSRLGGLVRTHPWVAVGFLLPALALAGIPPTSGFVGKWLLVRAAFLDGHLLAGAVAVVVSLFTLLSMVKIWTGAFWGDAPDPSAVAPDPSAVAPDPSVGLPDPSVDATASTDAELHPIDTPAGGGPTAPAVTVLAAPDLDAEVVAPPTRRALAGMVAPTLLVGALTLLLGLGAQPLVELVTPAAEALLDPVVYLEAVRDA